MKIITLHCDYIRFKALKKAVKDAEELDSKEEVEVKEPLVVLTAVEKGDSKSTLSELVKAIEKTAKDVKAKNVVLYPYAHLSSNLAPPALAQSTLQQAESLLSKKKLKITRAPFGYYKSFELKVKGHPLSELSKVLGESGVSPKQASAGVKGKPAQKIILDRRSLKPHDHRILGEDMELFHFSEEVGAGLPLWLPKGETIRNELINYMRRIEEKHGYKYVSTPHITREALYMKSGHLPYYKDSMYSPIEIEGTNYFLKPMNCPHHHMIYEKIVNSYRDLPLKLAEAGLTYRNELSGVTYGLIRVKGFTQNDSHIYVTPKQLKAEFLDVMRMFEEVYGVMGIKNYWFRLSLPDFKANPEKYTGDPKEWEFASEEIEKAMKECGKKVVKEKGEASFYGPKIDVQIKNSLGKEETIATSQVDIVVPKRMGLTYMDKDGKKKTPIIIHRAILGSYERFVAYLLEQTKGDLPLWLAPTQVRVVSFTERNIKSAEKLAKTLSSHSFRVDLDTKEVPIEGKIRDAETQKINYTIVIGDKEEKTKTLAVRSRGSKPKFGVKESDFIKDLKKELDEPYRKLQ
jgi:threonyl-tRNA synthetase